MENALTEIRVRVSTQQLAARSTSTASFPSLLRSLDYESLITYAHEVGSELAATKPGTMQWFYLNRIYAEVVDVHNEKLNRRSAAPN